jgi:hypothetical protein
MLPKCRSFAALITAIVVLCAFAGTAAAAPAVVSNTGQGNSTCSINASGGYYAGHTSTFVLRIGGLTLECSAVLVSGTPVSSTQVIRNPGGGTTLVLTPSGRAHLSITDNL